MYNPFYTKTHQSWSDYKPTTSTNHPGNKSGSKPINPEMAKSFIVVNAGAYAFLRPKTMGNFAAYTVDIRNFVAIIKAKSQSLFYLSVLSE